MDYMLFVKIVLIPVVISLTLQIISVIIYRNHLKSVKANVNSLHVVVKLPSLYIIIGITDIVVFLIFLLLSYYLSPDTAALWVRIGFILFVLLGILVVFASLRWRIDIYRDADYFEFRNLLKKKRIEYIDINNVEIKKSSITVHLDKGKFHIDPFAVNVEFFLAMINTNKIKYT